jgi:hypothetical protein
MSKVIVLDSAPVGLITNQSSESSICAMSRMVL